MIAFLAPYLSRLAIPAGLFVSGLLIGLYSGWSLTSDHYKAKLAEQQQQTIKQVEVVHAIKARNRAIPDGDASKRLREHWARN